MATKDGFSLKSYKAGEIVDDMREFTACLLIQKGNAVAYQSELQANMIKASLVGAQ